MSYKKEMGKRGETVAAEYLEKQGFIVTARNFRVGHDEIDIIAEDEKYIVFAEVKSRAQTELNRIYGRPASAVDYTKKRNLLRAANEYMRIKRPQKQPRIDVIEVYFPPITENTPIDIEKLIAVDIRHIRNAVHN